MSIPAVLSTFLIIQDVFGVYKGKAEIESFYLPAIVFFCIAIWFYFLQYHRLYFKRIDIKYTEEQFKETVQKTAEKLNWQITKNRKELFQASTTDFFMWGEMITIIKKKDYILINSICSPDKYSSLTSWGKNKKNINIFLKNMYEVINEVPNVPIIKVTENEYSFKRMLFRIIIYPICLIMILAGILMIYYHITLRNTLAGVGVVALAVVILYADIKLFFNYKKKKYEKEGNTKA